MNTFTFWWHVGHWPTNDDLDRANCALAGELCHYNCGVCPLHKLPRFVCGDYLLVKEPKTQERTKEGIM